MGFLDGLGAVAGGAADGFGRGVDIRGQLMQRRRAEEEAARAAAARAAVARSLMPPQPPMPGQSSQPAGPAMGPAGPMAPPAPAMGGAPMIPNMGAPAPPMPTAPAPPLPAGPVTPMAGPVDAPVSFAPIGAPEPNAGPQSNALSGVAEPAGNFFQDSQKTLRAMFANIQKSNPELDPDTAFQAVATQIELMKGVDESAKVYMQASVAQARVDAQMEMAAVKATSAAEVAQIRAEAMQYKADIAAAAAKDVAGIKGETARDVADTNAGARVGAASIGADSRRDVAETQAGASRYRDDKKYQGLVYDSVLNAYVEADKARVGADARVDAAGAMSGQKPRTPAYGGARGSSGNAAPGRTPPGQETRPAVAAPTYKSANDVATAYKAGKLSRDEAAKILRQKGWAN